MEDDRPSSSDTMDDADDTLSESRNNSCTSPLLAFKSKESLRVDNDDMMIKTFAMALRNVRHPASDTEEGELRKDDPLRYERWRAREALTKLGL